jgi:hypothetical protein
MKKFEVKLFNAGTNLLHSVYVVFAHDEDEAKKEASKLEAADSGPRVSDPHLIHAVTEIPAENVPTADNADDTPEQGNDSDKKE